MRGCEGAKVRGCEGAKVRGARVRRCEGAKVRRREGSPTRSAAGEGGPRCYRIDVMLRVLSTAAIVALSVSVLASAGGELKRPTPLRKPPNKWGGLAQVVCPP